MFVEQRALPLMSECFERAEFPRDLIRDIAELGVLGGTIPNYGSGFDYTSYGLICQELERGDSGLRSFVSVQSSLVMLPISLFGTEEQKRLYLPGLHRGELVGCFALTEPLYGSDAASLETTAVRDPSTDEFVLNGTKLWITNGPFADLAVVWARHDEGGRSSIKGFVVESDAPGYRVRRIERKLSLRISQEAELTLENCRVPASALLPGVEGMRGPLTCINEARFSIAFGVIGAAMACFESALEYATRRRQWGRPIAAFQLTQAKLVDALERITQGQLLAYQLGRLKDQGRLRHQQVSLAKRANCRTALAVAREMRGILGASGITMEHPVFRHMVNLEAVSTYEGTDEIHTLIVGDDITNFPAYRG